MENKKSFIEFTYKNFLQINNIIWLIGFTILFLCDKVPFEDYLICILFVLSSLIINEIHSAREHIIEEIKKSKDNEKV